MKMNGIMPMRIEWRAPLVYFAVLCFVVAGLAGISWKRDFQSGEQGTTVVNNKASLAGFDLDAGDSIYYEYEASNLCWFIITTDWFNPEIGEKLNISGTQNSGLFKCPVAGRYILQVLFLEVPEAGWATIDYEFYTLDDSSRMILIAKPILLTVLTVVLTSMVSIAGRRARTTYMHGKNGTTRSYWQYFASRISNWIAIVVGASMLVAASIVDLANLTSAIPGFIGSRLFGIGGSLLVLGLILSLMITYPKYVDDFIAKSRG